MKTSKPIVVLAISLLISIHFAFAQENQPTMYTVHTDHVKFDKMMQYEKAAKELNANFVKHNIQDVSWTAIGIEDGRYVYVSPIENMAELDKNIMAPLFEKMGEEAAGKLFDRMDECYDSHSDNIAYYLPELSYNPVSNASNEGKNYREYHFLYYPPRHRKAMKEAMKKVKAMFETKGIKNAYNVYHSGFGDEESYYMVSLSAADAMEIEMNSKNNDEVLGEEGQAVFYSVISLTSRYDRVAARIRPDLSYYPKK